MQQKGHSSNLRRRRTAWAVISLRQFGCCDVAVVIECCCGPWKNSEEGYQYMSGGGRQGADVRISVILIRAPANTGPLSMHRPSAHEHDVNNRGDVPASFYEFHRHLPLAKAGSHRNAEWRKTRGQRVQSREMRSKAVWSGQRRQAERSNQPSAFRS